MTDRPETWTEQVQRGGRELSEFIAQQLATRKAPAFDELKTFDPANPDTPITPDPPAAA